MKKATMTDVARAARVSQTTVSLVLRGKAASISETTRARVREVATALGYPVSPNARAPETRVIALVVPNLYSPCYAAILNDFERLLDANGYHLLVCNLNNPQLERYYLEICLSGRVDGVVFAFTPASRTLVDGVAGRLPAVLIGERDEQIDMDAINLDSYQAGGMLVRHLYARGHRRIGFLSGPPHEVSLAARRRLEGVRAAAEALGILEGFRQLSLEDYDDDGNVFEEAVRAGMMLTRRSIASGEGLSAMIAVDDITCLGIYRALAEAGMSVPGDMAVCCFENTHLSQALYPDVTSIDTGNSLRAKFAFDLLLERIRTPRGAGMALKTLSDPNLVVRGSA